MGSLYSVGYSGISGAAGYSGISGQSGTVIRTVLDHRLSLESGVSVSQNNQEAKTTLYLTPHIGNQISLYYNSRWLTYLSTEISLSLSGKTASKNHDVFAYYTGSAVALELVEWTNDSTRATALTTQDGVYAKTGDVTKRYIGTIRTTGTTGQCEDSFSSRYIWNMYNKVQRYGFPYNTTASWTYSTATFREFNAGTGEVRFKFVLGMPQRIFIEICSDTSTAGGCYLGAAIDTTTNYHAFIYLVSSYVCQSPNLDTRNYPLLSAGYHYMTAVEYAVSGTMTNYGYGASTTPGYGPYALWEG